MRAGLLTVQPQRLSDNYWNGGYANGKRGGDGNLYLITGGMATVSGQVACSDGGNGCGLTMTMPKQFAIQQGNSDHHVATIDPARNQEIDCWVCTSWPSVAAAGYYPLAGGTGLLPGGNGGWSGIAGSEAEGAVNVTAQELLTYALGGVHIGHALALLSGCVGPGTGVYPDIGKMPDTQCSASSPAPVYGGLVHLKSSYDVYADANARADKYCEALLFAAQDYGGFVADTTGSQDGIYIYFEGEGSYDTQASNPWREGPHLNADDRLINQGCFSSVPSSAIETAYFKSNTPVLPTQYAYGDPRN